MGEHIARATPTKKKSSNIFWNIVGVVGELLITFAVYGLVAALIKLDDAGAHLRQTYGWWCELLNPLNPCDSGRSMPTTSGRAAAADGIVIGNGHAAVGKTLLECADNRARRVCQRSVPVEDN